MKRFLYLGLGLLLLTGCKNSDGSSTEKQSSPSTEKPKKKVFEMYRVSEMAALMERMYADNNLIKQKIEEGKTDWGNFPDEYLKIHTAKLTDPSDLDDFFREHAQKFLEAQELVYTEPDKAKEHFNNMVQACITCHQKKCSGPIARIKKLYINN